MKFTQTYPSGSETRRLFLVNPTRARQAIINISPRTFFALRRWNYWPWSSSNRSCVTRFDREPGTQSGNKDKKRTMYFVSTGKKCYRSFSGGSVRLDLRNRQRKRDIFSLPTNLVTSRPDTNSSDTFSSSLRLHEGMVGNDVSFL